MAESNRPGSKVALWMFVVGLIAGIAGTVILPDLVRPYLPDAIGGSNPRFQGVITGKRVETDRVLLTLPTEGGTLLATFTNDVNEINLMIQEGDSVVLEVSEYKPFVENPRIVRVVTRSSPLTGDRSATGARRSETGDTLTADSAEARRDTIRAPADTSQR